MTTDYISIKITQNKVTIIDFEDADLQNLSWYAKRGGHLFYAGRTVPIDDGKRRILLMHRFIMSRILNRKLESTEHVDHIDHDGLNNRRSNLRLVSNAENSYNQRASTKKNKTSIYKGVAWNKQMKKYRASIRVNGKPIHLGSFDDENLAAIAYNNAAIKYFKEYANLNIIVEKQTKPLNIM